MASLQKLCLVVLIAYLASLAGARQLPSIESRLATRLNSQWLTDCWSALLELRSCSSDIVLFFHNGEAHLSLDCCCAVRVITHDCWPAMLSSLGFTAEKGDILRGYCDAENSPAPPALEPPVAAASASA